MKKLRCVMMRGGTSKGIFFHENELPRDIESRTAAILRVMGSPDKRQIDGLGGADILTSKAIIIGPPSRPDAEYVQVITYDLSDMEPQVSRPHSPENTVPVSLTAGVKIDQAVIGSCTNGRLKDLAEAAQILKGRQIHPTVRCIIIPGSQEVYLAALREGFIETFIEAGAAVSTPTCGPCVGGHTGVLAAGERCISTTNRNFVGRMGSPEAEIYLASPAVAAASAVVGEITNPEEVVK